MSLFVPKEWKDRLAEFAGRRKLTNVSTGEETTVDVSRAEGEVSQAGDAFSAANMNDLEQRIKDGFDKVDTNLEWKLLDSVTGNTIVTLPEDFSELFILAKAGNTQTSNKYIAYSFNIIRDVLPVDDPIFLSNGYAHETSKGSTYCQLKITKKSVFLNEFYNTGYNNTSTAILDVYYK